MGEVYRARDARLGREVAIKVLPAAFGQDPERLARFEREARLLASLNHANIAHVYGFESASLPEGGSAHFLAMELVEGEDLAERLKRGAIPVDEAIAIARQIAEALEEAHEKGVVHRDLKPANVKVTPDGRVKVLDFGLAKALTGDAGPGSSPDLSQSPTLAHTGTATGLILGTAAYMSPEQARGRAVDKRADIWSFGVVLFELLTGQRLFTGETVSDTLAAVLKEDVPWTALPSPTPRTAVQLLRRCIVRDPRQRLRDVGEARVALSEPLESPTSETRTPPAAADAASRRRPGEWAVLALIVVASAVAGAWVWARLRTPDARAVTRFTIPMPRGQVLTGISGPAISRDGRTIAYVARDPAGVARLYLRSLDRLEPAVVPESETAQQPFFSPSGDRVGFFARGKLMTAAVAGGAPGAIADGSYMTFGGTWGEDDTIVFVPTLMSGLLRIPASGGKPVRLTEPDGAAKGYAHAFPQYLPGGRGIVFTVWGAASSEVSGAAFLPPDSSTWTTVASARWRGSYASSGHLLLSGPRNITAVPFEPGRRGSKGAPTLVIEDVFANLNTATSWFATSASGTLVYVPGDPSLGQLAWVDRGGLVSKIENEPSRLADPILSPDGSKVVYVQDETLWTMELRRGTRSRLTLDHEGENRFAAWSRDGATVFFASNRSGEWNIYSVPATGGGARLLLNRPGVQFPLSTSPDGTLLFAARPAGNATDLFLLSPKGEVTAFVVSPFSKVAAQFSPDGRLVAYASDDTGRDEIYVCSVAHPDEVVTVSTDGGRGPRWSPDGKELFYRHGDAFLAAPITSDGKLSVGDSLRLFEVQAASGTSTQEAGYSVSPDGSRFLVQLPDPRAIPTRIDVVLNWFEELKAKVPSR